MRQREFLVLQGEETLANVYQLMEAGCYGGGGAEGWSRPEIVTVYVVVRQWSLFPVKYN
jgi:hypothetical protein